MLHLIIDTSVYRQDPDRKKAGFQMLDRLLLAKAVTLHVPFYVLREFSSQQMRNYLKPFPDVSSSLSSLERRHLPSNLAAEVSDVESQLVTLARNVAAYAEREFESWCNQREAVIHPVSAEHGMRVAQAYFDGRPPFTREKSRDDFPDAFIFEQVKDLARHHGDLKVIVADKKLQDACAQLSNVEVYETLDEFIQCGDCQVALRDRDVVDRIDAIFSNINRNYETLAERVNQLLEDETQGLTFWDREMESENGRAQIERAWPLEEDALSFGGIRYYGGGVFVLPFNTVMAAQLTYSIDRNRAYHLSDYGSENIEFYDSENSTDCEVAACEKSYIDVQGRVSLSVDVDELLRCLETSRMQQLLLDAALELEKLTDVALSRAQ